VRLREARDDATRPAAGFEARGAIETAHRAHRNCGRVFRYAIATGRASAIRLPMSVVPSRRSRRSHAALTDPKAMGELLRAIDGYRGSFVTGAEPGLDVG
jgi:Phage integrase central domain